MKVAKTVSNKHPRKVSRLLSSTVAAFALCFASTGQAQSLVDGVYISDGQDNGAGQCTLLLKSIEQTHKYGDAAFELESSGDGSCEWSAIGMAKSFSITAGLITNSGTPAFVKVTFPYGPAGGHLQITTFDLDGSVRNEQSFAKQDEETLTSG
jgi:hypothetical protein